MYSWRSTTLSQRKKLTSSSANMEWCHVYFSCGLCNLSVEKSDQARTPWNYFAMKNSTLNPHKIMTGLPLTINIRGLPVPCPGHWEINQCLVKYFGTNWIIDNWHWYLGVKWCKWNNYFDNWLKKIWQTDNYYFIDHYKFFPCYGDRFNKLCMKLKIR